MKVSFYEYNVAMSGLFTARANLNVISHNVANAGLPGYSRQYALQKASRPLSLGNGRGMYGTGSEVYGVAQIRDVYLDRKYWQQKAVLGEYAAKNTHLSLVETVFNDLSETGVRSSFLDFFNRLQDLSTTSQDATYRTNVITAAETLAELIRTNAEALQKQQRDINQEISGVVQRVNSLGTQIASISQQIHQYEADGSVANDLRDQRALLVDQLSEYVNVDVEEYDYSTENIPYDKRFTVMINGYDFVNHTNVNQLTCVPRDYPNSVSTTGGSVIPSGQKRNDMDVPGLFDIYFADSGSSFDIYSTTLKGTLKGLVDMRDGNNGFTTMPVNASDPSMGNYTTTNYKGIPFYMNKLNIMVRTFARAMNEGLDVNGNPIPDVTGHLYGYDFYGKTGTQLFFSYSSASNGALQVNGTGTVSDFNKIWQYNDDGSPKLDADGNQMFTLDYSTLNCLNIAVNPHLTQDPRLLACSSDPTKGESANDVILGFVKINSYPSLFKEGKLLDFIIGTTDHLSIDRMQANNFEESYYEITMATDNQRLSVSGVDINEEMMAMIKYNQMYQACAKLVNVINNIYDTMINRLGLG